MEKSSNTPEVPQFRSEARIDSYLRDLIYNRNEKDDIIAYLTQKYTINTKNDFQKLKFEGSNLLHWAIFAKNLHFAKVLIENELVDVNDLSESGESIVTNCVLLRRFEILDMLLEHNHQCAFIFNNKGLSIFDILREACGGRIPAFMSNKEDYEKSTASIKKKLKNLLTRDILIILYVYQRSEYCKTQLKQKFPAHLIRVILSYV